VSRKKCRGQNGRYQAPEAVNKSRAVILSPSPVILSEAKNLRSWLRVDSAKDPSSCFWSSYLRRTAEMLLPQGGISMTGSNSFTPCQEPGHPHVTPLPNCGIK